MAYSGYTNGDLGTLASNGTLNVEPTGSQTAVTTATFYTLNLTGTVGVTMSGSGSLTLAGGGLIGNTSGTITGGTRRVARRGTGGHHAARPHHRQHHRQQRQPHGADQGRVRDADS